MSTEQSQEHRLLLPDRNPIELSHLSKPELKALATFVGVNCVGANETALVNSLTDHIHVARPQRWTLRDLPGSAPERRDGLLCSDGRYLYMFGGIRPDNQNQSWMMKCDSETGYWEPVTSAFEPVDAFPGRHSGVVLGADFYAIGCKSSVAIKDLYSGATDGVLPGEPVLYIYNFWNNLWRSRELPKSPACGQGSLMAVRGTQLIVYGKSNPGELCSEEGVWTLDCVSDCYAWQPRPVTGDLPPQARAFAFTAASDLDHAYVAVLEESPTKGLRIYELDLQSWHWRRLPALNTDFEMDPVEDTIATTFIQGRWTMHGGSKQSDDDFEGENQLHVFDINTMSWSKPLRPDYHMEYRTGHMATCHKGNMIVLGGEDDTGEDEDEFWNTAVTIACHPGWDSQRLDETLKNFQPLAIDRQLFPDATVTVGGKDFVAHRSVSSTASPHFRCMFSSEMQEGITAKATIADMEPETFELMLGWMYSTIYVVLPLDQAVDVYVASDRLGMTALHDACAHIIAQTLPGISSSRHIEDVVELWHFATRIQSEVVIKACIRQLSKHPDGHRARLVSGLWLADPPVQAVRPLGSVTYHETCALQPWTPPNQFLNRVKEAPVVAVSAEVDKVGSVAAGHEPGLIEGTQHEHLHPGGSPMPAPPGQVVQTELQESEPGPAIVALASLPDLLRRPARGGLARQADDLICHYCGDDSCSLICHNNSDDNDSCSITSNTSSIASFIREVTSPTGQQAGDTNKQGSLCVNRSTAEASIFSKMWADLAEYPAFSQDMYLSSRNAASPVGFSQGWKQQAKMDSFGLGLVLNKVADGCREQDSTEADKAVVMQPCPEGPETKGVQERHSASTSAAENNTKASWPDLAGQTAISARLNLSCRMAATPLGLSRGRGQQGMMDTFGLGVILDKGPTQKDSVEVDEAVVMHSCTEEGLLCGGLCPEPTLHQAAASPDRNAQESRNDTPCFQKAVGAVGQLAKGWAWGGALLRKGLLGVMAGGHPPMRR